MNLQTAPSPSSLHIVAPRLRLPVVRGVIDRRILVNFRCDPEVLSHFVPGPFRVKICHGFGLAGICLIRLRRIGPRWLPGPLGFTSENAAHRIAVEWDEAGRRCEGVFIPRRDTNSRLNELAGGRVFPGIHHHANFRVWESPQRFKIECGDETGGLHVRVAARVAEAWPAGSIFRSLEEASEFFRAGSLGWSARPDASEFDGVELRTRSWSMEPLVAERVESSFFDDPVAFPSGSAEFDSAILMRGIEHEWHGRGRMLYRDPISVL